MMDADEAGIRGGRRGGREGGEGGRGVDKNEEGIDWKRLQYAGIG